MSHNYQITNCSHKADLAMHDASSLQPNVKNQSMLKTIKIIFQIERFLLQKYKSLTFSVLNSSHVDRLYFRTPAEAMLTILIIKLLCKISRNDILSKSVFALALIKV